MTGITMAPPAERAALPRRGAQMGRYALWQMRDYMMERGLPTMIIVALVGWIAAMPIRAMVRHDMINVPQRMIARFGSADAARQATLERLSMGVLGQFLGSVVFLGALLAMSGLVSNDRKNGFYRFLFAKPVTPERYYGQAFLIHALGFLVVIVALLLLWSGFVSPVISADLLVSMMLVWLCYAGIAFVLSAAARWDWISLVAVSLASTVLWDKFGESTSPFAKLLYLLPPLTKVDSVYAAVTQHLALPWHTLGWLAGYGAVCYAAGLVVLHHRRLATP